jgi:hypothetical protein
MDTRKTLKMTFLCMLMVLFLSTYAQARIAAQPCVNCHTMHNSQNGSSMSVKVPPPAGSGNDECKQCHAEPRVVLLRYDCIGCHAANPGSGASNIINTGWPQVAHNNATDLAGGNYSYVCNIGDEKGHNVHGFGSCIINDLNFASIGFMPPGYESGYDPSLTHKYTVDSITQQVKCAGTQGCHGNREELSPYTAMRGTHHADDSMLKFYSINTSQQGGGSGGADTVTAGRSYRFLYNVLGGEETSWNANATASNHNEYSGLDTTPSGRSGQSWTDIKTISNLCAECHGYFHSDIGSSGAWIRHPTDVILPNSGEYSAYTSYSNEAPVARVNIPDSPSSLVQPGTDDAIIMCLSCHRAHASPYDDALRWDYSTMNAGGGGSGGCFTCHAQKSLNN